MRLERLALHSHIMPCLARAVAAPSEEHDTTPDDAESVLDSVISATVFDCRPLDPRFVMDTGDAALHEAEQLAEELLLPFPQCYFEFSDESSVLVRRWENYQTHIDDDVVEASLDGAPPGARRLGSQIEVYPFYGWGCWEPDEYDGFNNSYGSILFGKDPCGDDGYDHKYWEPVNVHQNPVAEVCVESAMKMFMGALTLLHEKLVATAIRPDPSPKLTKARAKRGRLPLSCETRVLTINTAAVRRIAVRPRGSHESPRLHWRRGHWRALHRGSEFESKAWVRRCLVGDPARGFIHKDYRVAWQTPMLQGTPA